MSTLISRDIEEITGIHLRSKTGLGPSLALDQILLHATITDIVSSFQLEPVTTELLRDREYISPPHTS